VNPDLFELKDETGKHRVLYNLKHQKPYLDNGKEKEDRKYWKVRPPPKRKKEAETVGEFNTPKTLLQSEKSTY
jgi:hypothetical protein